MVSERNRTAGARPAGGSSSSIWRGSRRPNRKEGFVAAPQAGHSRALAQSGVRCNSAESDAS
eukprot:2457018-Pleurochrysis_carterae.AAC.1